MYLEPFVPSYPPNTGASESIHIEPNGGDNIVFGIAGDDTTGTSGGYIISVTLTVFDGGNTCETTDYDDARVVCAEENGEPVDWASRWSGVTQVTPITPNAVGDGFEATLSNENLSTGEPMCTLEWASYSSVTCFPATDFDYFEGNHNLYVLEIPANTETSITVKPDPDVEVSIYGYWLANNDCRLPPALSSSGNCDASYRSSTGAPNPGDPEMLYFSNPTDNTYNYIFGVAGYDPTNEYGLSGMSGTYDIEIEMVESGASHCEESLPGATYAAWPSVVNQLAVSSGMATVDGDLSDGSCVDLAFASTSSTACFPATQFEYYQGNVMFYALEEPIPANSEVTVTVTPGTGVDVNLFGYLSGTTAYPVPPAVSSVSTCEEDHQGDAGEAESIFFSNPTGNEYNLFFAVAGPNGVADGDFTVEVAIEEDQVHCEESLPGASYADWPASVEEVTLTAGRATVNGNLNTGDCVNLDWASDSENACFINTRFHHFNGRYGQELCMGERERNAPSPSSHQAAAS